MNTSMIISSTTMQNIQRKIDTIANNMANVNTPGYKRQQVQFNDLLTTARSQEEEFRLDGRKTPLGITEDWGAQLIRMQLDMSQGALLETGLPLDLAIVGNALFEVAEVRLNEAGEPEVDADGNIVYDRAWTRHGSFQLVPIPGDEANLRLVTAEGRFVQGMNDQPITVPRDHRIVIDDRGNIVAYNERVEEAPPVVVGQLKIMHVLRPQMLESIGGHLLRVTDEEQIPNVLEQINLNEIPEEDIRSSIAIRQGFLEQSNVDIGEEMTELMIAQRSLQFAARALSSADTMMDLTNRLRG